MSCSIYRCSFLPCEVLIILCTLAFDSFFLNFHSLARTRTWFFVSKIFVYGFFSSRRFLCHLPRAEVPWKSAANLNVFTHTYLSWAGKSERSMNYYHSRIGGFYHSHRMSISWHKTLPLSLLSLGFFSNLNLTLSGNGHSARNDFSFFIISSEFRCHGTDGQLQPSGADAISDAGDSGDRQKEAKKTTTKKEWPRWSRHSWRGGSWEHDPGWGGRGGGRRRAGRSWDPTAQDTWGRKVRFFRHI